MLNPVILFLLPFSEVRSFWHEMKNIRIWNKNKNLESCYFSVFLHLYEEGFRHLGLIAVLKICLYLYILAKVLSHNSNCTAHSSRPDSTVTKVISLHNFLHGGSTNCFSNNDSIWFHYSTYHNKFLSFAYISIYSMRMPVIWEQGSCLTRVCVLKT